MINIDSNRAKDGSIYTDKYYWYPKGQSTTHKQNQDTYYGSFYACDRVDFNNDEQQLNGISDVGLEHLTIETPKRYDFKKGDRIRSITDERFWEVQSATVNDSGIGKELSLRPSRVTILVLVRTEVDRYD